jgi:hypothetical protein
MTLTPAEQDRLRSALTLIGTTGARASAESVDHDPAPSTSDPDPGPMRGDAKRAHRARLVIASGAAAAAVAVVGTVVVLERSDEGKGESGSTTSAQTEAEYYACAETIVVGRVEAVTPNSDGTRVSVEVKATEWLKPGAGPRRVSIDVLEPTAYGLQPFEIGTTYLVSVPTNPNVTADAFAGDDIADGRRVLAEGKAISEREGTACPEYWQNLVS